MVNKDQIKGRVNEVVGKVTGDGKKELKGKVQKHYGDTKNKVEKAAKDLEEKLDDAKD